MDRRSIPVVQNQARKLGVLGSLGVLVLAFVVLGWLYLLLTGVREPMRSH